MATYKSGWDKLKTNDRHWIFRQNVILQFNRKNVNTTRNSLKTNLVEFPNLPTSVLVGPSLPISSRLSKEEMNKFKFYSKNKEKTVL